jgi:hypothetical protein
MGSGISRNTRSSQLAALEDDSHKYRLYNSKNPIPEITKSQITISETSSNELGQPGEEATHEKAGRPAIESIGKNYGDSSFYSRSETSVTVDIDGERNETNPDIQSGQEIPVLLVNDNFKSKESESAKNINLIDEIELKKIGENPQVPQLQTDYEMCFIQVLNTNIRI